MMPRTRTYLLLAAATLTTQACNRDRDDRAVQTQSDAGTLVSSLSPDSADKRGLALIRVANAVPTSRGLVIRSDDTHVLPTVKFGMVGAYQPIDQTWASFQVGDTLGGTFVPLTTNRELLTNGERYTLIVLRNEQGTAFETTVVRDQQVTAPGKASLRFVHAAPGIKEVIVQPRGGAAFVEGLDYGEDYVDREIDPWNGVLEVRADRGTKPLLVTPTANFEAGKAYTVVLTRSAQGKIGLFWYADSPSM